MESNQAAHNQLKRLLETIRSETIPMAGHQDPHAVDDCWRMAYDLIEEMDMQLKHTEAYYNSKLDDAQSWMDRQAKEISELRKRENFYEKK